jgi:undecaprenyl-diphosphatase
VCLTPLAFVLLAISLGIGTGDSVTRYFTSARDQLPGLTEAMSVLSDKTIALFYCAYAFWGFSRVARHKPQEARLALFFALVQLCVTILLVYFFKFSLGKPRPLPLLSGAAYSPWVGDSDFHSFPSGHSAEITGAASLPAVLLRRYGISLIMGMIIALIGFSRVYLSRHHLSDIVAGCAAGTFASLLTYHLHSRESA